jgi:hypothetical protein
MGAKPCLHITCINCSSLVIPQGITRLKQALQQDPERTDAEWCLGNAYTSLVRPPPPHTHTHLVCSSLICSRTLV